MEPARSVNPSSMVASPKNLRRVVLYLLSISPVLVLLALLAWGQLRTNPGGLLEHNETGDVAIEVRAAPPVEGIDLATGRLMDSSAIDGKIIMVGFWSSWCVACRVEASALAQVYDEYAGQPIEFIGVAIWDDNREVLRHIEQYSVGYPNVLDARGATAVSYGVRGVPEKFFLDADGRIIRKIIGPMTPERLREVLDELLAAQTPA